MESGRSITPDRINEFAKGTQSASLDEEFRLEVQSFVNASLFFFCKYILGFLELDEKVHGASCGFTQKVLQTPDGFGLLEDPRGHFKSSTSTIGGGLHPVFSDPIPRTPYKGCNTRVLIASAKRENATNFLRLIRWFYDENRLLKWLRPELYPLPGELVTKSTKQLTVKRTMGFAEPTWDTVGAESGAASRHCDIVFCDDLIHEKNYRSQVEVEAAIEFAKYSGQLTGIERGTRMFVGNSWDLYDLNNSYLKGWDLRDDISIFSRGGEACKKCWLGRDISWGHDGYFKEHVHEGKVWPLLPQKAHGAGPMTWEDLRKERNRLGPRIYAAQILNETLDPSILDFQIEWLNLYDIAFDDLGKRYVLYWETPAMVESVPQDGRKFIQVRKDIEDLQRFMLVDPNFEEKSSGSRTAILIVGMEKQTKRIFILDCFAKAMNIEDIPDLMVKKYKEWHPYRIGVEAVAAQRLIGSTFRRIAATEHNIRIPEGVIVPCFAGRNIKPERIRARLTPIFSAGQVYIQKRFHDFIDEYRKFPRGQYMDILDALSYITEVWKIPSHYTPEQRDKRKRRRRFDRMRRRAADPRFMDALREL